MQGQRVATIVATPMSWRDLQGVSKSNTFFPPFPPSGSQICKGCHSKATAHMGKFRKLEKMKARKGLRISYAFTSGWSPAQRNLSTAKKQKIQKGRADYQSYIIRFECPVFQQKNHKAYKRKEKYGPLKRTKYTSRNIPEQTQILGLLGKDLKHCLKNAQSTNGWYK